jgi:hypothetical protein
MDVLSRFISINFDFALFVAGKPLAGELLFLHFPTSNFLIPAGLANSQVRSLNAATASSVFSLRKNGVEFGTITFAAAGTIATFAAAGNTSFTMTDRLELVAPATQDAALADISFVIRAKTQ